MTNDGKHLEPFWGSEVLVVPLIQIELLAMLFCL